MHLRDVQTDAESVFGSGRAEFDAGCARYFLRLNGVQAELRVAVSPENGALIQQLRLEHRSDGARRLEVTGCMAVALAADRDMRAHPVFQNLFVESERISPTALAFRRRSRERGVEHPQLVYLISGATEAACETELDRLVGRTGSLGEPGGIARELSGTCGSVLNPCAALRVSIELEPGEKRTLHFALACIDEEKREATVKNLSLPAAAERTMQLAEACARAALSF